ncbi:MAG TPA: TonB-dependent receptor [Bryobacterales bacterium]|nr:TonB-dependent receptor [Bryobacterales bacterium]
MLVSVKTLLLAGCLLPLAAQTLDTGILGTVTDPSGAVVASATVTITQAATGVEKTVTTDAGGRYEVRYLVPGEYVVEAKAQGFRTERKSGLEIQIGQLAPINFSLQVGNVVETVEVTSTAPLLHTENATLGEVVAPERMVNLPLNGRSFVQLSVLTPGVRTSEPSQFTASTGGSRIIANGARDAWMQVNIDGITMVDNRSNYVNLYPIIDALQEFKVQTSNYSAEYGGNAGANTNLQLRSGANQLHGSAWEFLRNDKLDARSYFRPAPFPKDRLKRNQFGTVVSGPIRKDKTFFMVAYEGVRAVQESAGTSIVLTPAQRLGDFSATASPVIDPFTGSAFPGNTIPKSRLNPVSANLINQYMPLPNTSSGAVNYSGVTQGHLATDQGAVRVDQYFSARDQVFVHYIRWRRDFPNIELNPNFYFNGTQPISNFSTQYVHTFSATLLNEVRFGFNLINVSVLSPRQGSNFTIASLGINGLNVGGPSGRPLRPDEQGFPVIGISGFMGMGDDQGASNLDNSQAYQWVDNLTWIRGGHSFKFGGDIRRLRSDATTNNWPFGNMAFTGDISGNAAADYMLGFPRTTLTPEGVPISKIRQWRMGLYAQDDWKVNSNLTLNLGLRYDFVGQPHDINGVTRTLRFDMGPQPVLFPPAGQVADVWKNEYLYFSPRFGFAYRLPHNMVVRGGYGIFYSAAQYDNTNILQLNPPTAGSLTVTNPAVNPVATIDNPVPAVLYPTNPIFNVVSIPQDRLRHNAYLQNWNIQVSRELTKNDVLEVGWVGSKGTHVDTSLNNFNNPDPGPGTIQARRPYPQYARIRMIAADVNTIYQSLQTRYEHRFSRGLSVTGAYTWSHLIDDAGETINAGGCVCQNPRARGKAERGSSVLDQRHRMVIGYVWEMPFTKNLKGAPGGILGGWSLGGILTFASGLPFNVTQSGDSENNDGLWERPNLVPGQSVNAANQTPNQWFNTAAFQRALLQYGNSPRDPLVGPGTNTWDLSASKSFKIPRLEGHQLMFRSELFNAFNAPQFSNPGSALGTGTFGRITGTANANRQIQFALKYMF